MLGLTKTTITAKVGLFENRGGFLKLGHKFFKSSGDKVKCKHYKVKNNSLSNVSNVSKYTNLCMQFRASLSRGHQTVTIMNHFCYCLMATGK